MEGLDYPTLLTAALAVVVALGGGVALVKLRSKAVTFMEEAAEILRDMSMLLVMFSAAMTDDKITTEEWKEIGLKAVEIKDHVMTLKEDLKI